MRNRKLLSYRYTAIPLILVGLLKGITQNNLQEKDTPMFLSTFMGTDTQMDWKDL